MTGKLYIIAMAYNSRNLFIVTTTLTVVVILCFSFACNLLYTQKNISLTLNRVRSLEKQLSVLQEDGGEDEEEHGVATPGEDGQENALIREESELSRLYGDDQQVIRLKRSEDTTQKKENTPGKQKRNKAKGMRREGKKEKDKGRSKTAKKRKKTKKYPVQPATSFTLRDESSSSGWSMPYWVRDTGDLTLTRLSSGEIQVKRGGLYFLYSMVTFTLRSVELCNTSMQFGFGIFAIDNLSLTFNTKILRCKTPQSCRMEERISCYAGRMVQLNNRNIIRLLIQSEISHDTLVIPDSQGTYIGLIYLGG